MLALFSVPLGILCLVLTVLCLRARKTNHALACALAGLVLIGAAVLLSYGASVLIHEISRIN